MSIAFWGILFAITGVVEHIKTEAYWLHRRKAYAERRRIIKNRWIV